MYNWTIKTPHGRVLGRTPAPDADTALVIARLSFNRHVVVSSVDAPAPWYCALPVMNRAWTAEERQRLGMDEEYLRLTGYVQ